MTTERRDEHQPPIERLSVGHRILERIRAEMNSEGAHFVREDGQDVFHMLYLTERAVCIPEDLLGEDILIDIRNLYYWVMHGIREELQERVAGREFLWVLVDPTYEDATSAVLLSEDKFLLHINRKAWYFYWGSEDEMAEELETWYAHAAKRLGVIDLDEPHSDSEKESFQVTLRLERLLVVAAKDKEEAAELAMAWQDNENDVDVQLSFEEVLGGTVDPVNGTDSSGDIDLAQGGGGGSGGPKAGL